MTSRPPGLQVHPLQGEALLPLAHPTWQEPHRDGIHWGALTQASTNYRLPQNVFTQLP